MSSGEVTNYDTLSTSGFVDDIAFHITAELYGMHVMCSSRRREDNTITQTRQDRPMSCLPVGNCVLKAE